ncbi:kinase-like domain-containing protein [Plectosphaerella plurivora]|uniref:non-specific serine/threonine protein kinase n=1 Tax=Plectosphaerella plurivora TaxID=936078 RepID=A0A9P8V887_9PEZI|nr:kinase-like domain-containing protein [Plectosphaerella plurivora]
MSSTTRPQTPPHQPLHGVRMSARGIDQLLRAMYPECVTISVAQLPSGRSFNNRIYNVKADRGQAGAEDLVFKLAGRFFKSDKIQNEVICLRLMEIHCPEVPAPRVRAWSEDGRSLVRISSDGDGCETIEAPESEEGDHSGGWILMTRVPGEPVVPEEWDQKTMMALAHQLADMVATWRRKIPAIRHSANLLFCDRESVELSLSMSNMETDFPWTKAQGLIGVPVDATPRAKQPASLVEYYQMRLESALYEVETKDIYALNRNLCVLVRRFAAETLPRLSLASGPPKEKAFVFTHRDLSTRNILVEGNPPRITGVVDFEFSGFFPETEEFVNAFDDEPGDWPKGFTAAYRDELEIRGVATPLKSFDQVVWDRILSLDRLVEHIAPWWLAGQESQEVLRDELEKAGEVVRREIVALENSLD